MRQSKLFSKTRREIPKDEKSINARLLARAGFIYKEMAGVYTYLPLGLRVLKKIENIIREEMNAIGGQEIEMTVFQPRNLWEETGRWTKDVGEVMYKCKENGKEIGLGPTHEEMLTDIVRHQVKSYTDLPLSVYQIQTKFRKEPRARSGLLRGREFPMKDLYSFHTTEKDFQNYYEIAKRAYFKIFERCGLEVILTQASGTGFTKEYTHEFQVLAPGGEDTTIFCPKKDFAQNKEITKSKKGSRCPVCKNILREAKSIEVGNIFPLGKKYSQDMNATFVDKDGKKKFIVMGCYGIGVSRTLGAVVEVNHDEKGIIWPEEISPFQVHLIYIENTEKVREVAERLYKNLSFFAPQKRSYGGSTVASGVGGQRTSFEVLYDDRVEKTAGEKFTDCDLIGIPWRVLVSEKTLQKKSVEIKKRNKKETRLVKIGNIKQIVQS